MKKITSAAIAATVCLCLTQGASLAQTGQWKLAGNALNGTQKLGSTNNFGVDIFTNNVKRMSITNTGNFRFNSDQLSLQFPNPGSTPKPMMFLYESGSSNKARMIMAYSPGFPAFGLRTDGFNKFDFTDGINSALTIDLGADNIGVNTFSPKTRLHVFNASAGVSPIANTTLTLENSTNNYISVLTPNASESGILFANPGNAASGGIVYNSFGSSNGLQFRTNGNVTRMALTRDGFLNIGPSANEDYMVQINHNGNLGLDLVGNATDWEIFAGSTGLNLFVDGGAGGAKGIFNRFTGVYSALSDERSKTNIKPMANVLEKISQLKPASYQFKNVKDQTQYDGFIAQEVMKVFPNLVTHNIESKHNADQYLLNYSGFGVIAVKAIQELVQVIKEQDERIAKLEQAQGIAISNGATESNISKIPSVAGAILEQNQPNPFNAVTTIRYQIPQGSKAQLQIFNASGILVKNLTANESGQAIINAGELSAGTYTYSLIVNGKPTASKKMIRAK